MQVFLGRTNFTMNIAVKFHNDRTKEKIDSICGAKLTSKSIIMTNLIRIKTIYAKLTNKNQGNKLINQINTEMH